MSNTALTRPAPTGFRRAATSVLGVLGAITLAALAVQVGLAALGAFGAGFAAHETFGYLVGLLTLLTLIAAGLARPGARCVLLAAVLFVLAGPLQPLLAGYGHGVVWLGALHGFDAAVLLALAGWLTVEAWRRRTAPTS